VAKIIKISSRVICVAALAMFILTFVLASPASAAEGTLNFLRSSPENGGTGVPIENVGVKLFFDSNVTHESVWTSNSKAFKLTDPDGNNVSYEAFPGQKPGEEGYILVLARPVPVSDNMPGQLIQDAIYTLTVSGDLMAVSGARLGEEIRINFQTMDMAANSRLSMIVMVVMMVGIIVFMFLTNMKKMRAEAEAAALMKANPYRIAKDKSITIDEAKALIEKAKERNQKQLEKTGGKAPEPEEKKSVAPRLESKKKTKKTHKVKGPRPVSEGGSSFKSKRQAEKARQARADAARKAATTGQKGTGSGAKKKSKGKGKRR